MVPMLVYRSERTVVQSKRQVGIDHFTYKLIEKKSDSAHFKGEENLNARPMLCQKRQKETRPQDIATLFLIGGSLLGLALLFLLLLPIGGIVHVGIL